MHKSQQRESVRQDPLQVFVKLVPVSLLHCTLCERLAKLDLQLHPRQK
jgi:hypothetical protein